LRAAKVSTFFYFANFIFLFFHSPFSRSLIPFFLPLLRAAKVQLLFLSVK